MTDGIIKGTGNSRYLKGPANAPALWSTHEAFMQALAAGEVLIDLNGINQLGWDTIGDKLGKETLLKDETAQAAGLTTDAVPDDVLAWLIGQAKGIRSIATGGTGNATGNAASATKLQTARTIQTNLASTSAASFNGTANVTPGVTGVLPVANGGTGATSLSTLANAIVPYLSSVTKIATGSYVGTKSALSSAGTGTVTINHNFGSVPKAMLLAGQYTKTSSSYQSAYYFPVAFWFHGIRRLLVFRFHSLGSGLSAVVEYIEASITAGTSSISWSSSGNGEYYCNYTEETYFYVLLA